MRKYIGKYFLLLIICLALGIGVFFYLVQKDNQSSGQRQTLMNRVSSEVSAAGRENFDSKTKELVASNNWAKEYGESNVPVSVRYVDGGMSSDGSNVIAQDSTVISITEDGEFCGLLVFAFEQHKAGDDIL